MVIRIAIRALGRNRVRSALTMLGVIIGVGAVIAMVAIGQGATNSVQKQIASMGQNQLMILPGSSSSGAVMFGAGSVQTLTPVDAAAIARDCPSATAVGVVVRTRAQIVYQNVNWAPATVQGCNPDFLAVRDWPVVEGAAFTDADVKAAAQVCLVGQTVAENLFADGEPVGKAVRLKGLPFKVVGVLGPKGANAFGSDQDDVVLLPWTTVKKKLQGSAFANVDQILVGAASPEDLKPLEEEIRTVLAVTHRLQRNGSPPLPDDFTIRNMTELLGAMTATTGVMTALLAAIASVSLLVGGIGIMNIMLVSVTERTREIGLRMAVGARSRDVLSQFLVESIVLSGIGGVLGIALGAGVALAVARFAQWPAVISLSAILVAVLFSGAVGVVFGFYPAWRASRLDPIEALRYE
ncbi:MAG: FtsX-like permease family protein [Deltaproteobacteria bacterium]|nr:FtsX-like permease family protein [Deltaproteobacteria bacterium]